MAVEQIPDPVVATEHGVRLLLHARSLRGTQTLVEIATRAGINRDELSRFEKGETTQVRFATIAKLLAAYNCSLEDLFEVERASQPESAPLYAGALAALTAGTLPRSVSRRAVRRSTELDVVSDVEEQAFARSPVVSAGRRRAPVGTAHQ